MAAQLLSRLGACTTAANRAVLQPAPEPAELALAVQLRARDARIAELEHLLAGALVDPSRV